MTDLNLKCYFKVLKNEIKLFLIRKKFSFFEKEFLFLS